MRVLLLVSCLVLGSCGIGGYHIKDVAKSDIALVSDIHQKNSRILLSDLLRKLYKRNPSQLPSHRSVDNRINQLLVSTGYLEFTECGSLIETQLMEAVLQPAFNGDRVFCLMAGLIGMVNHSYNYKAEFYAMDSLDEQKLYKSARNIELLAWRLRKAAINAAKADSVDQPVLLTFGLNPTNPNLSFERLYGKLISQQDLMARVIADQNKRAINFVMHSVASFFFIPL